MNRSSSSPRPTTPPPQILPRWTSSRRPVKKKTWGCHSCPNSGNEADAASSTDEEHVDDTVKDPDYIPKKKTKLKRQFPLDKCKKPSSFEKNASSSSSDDDDSPAPKLPPRARGASSVLVISRSTKPAHSN